MDIKVRTPRKMGSVPTAENVTSTRPPIHGAVAAEYGIVCVCVCVFIKLHITAQPAPVKLIFQCYSNGSALCVCVCVHHINRSGLNLMINNPPRKQKMRLPIRSR